MLTTSSLPPPPPVAAEEPEPKKLKMSTTTSDDEECTTATGTKIRYKRRKVAIFFAYCGVGYQGMQKNPGAKTIEGDLEEALYMSGAVPEQDRGIPKRYDWARSARTDKGVSAVGQVVSGRFYIDPPGFVDRLNSNLTSQIRIFGYKRVTASFNAKKFCDRRRYVYLIPVFALDPNCHRDTVMASLGSGNELVKCLECSERGRKVVGLVGNRKHNLELEAMDIDAGISSNTNAVVDSAVTGDVELSLSKGDDNHLNEEFGNDTTGDLSSKTDLETVIPDCEEGTPLNGESVKNSDILEEEKVNGEDESTDGSGFCYGEKERERFNKILKYFVGTHNFHNFTTRTKAEDPAARRYIISFNANTTLVVEGMEFVKCEVVGQSFMLHQIRKMIGLAVAIMRNCAPESLIDKALQQDVNINVPTAPEVGLYLDECFFSSYNQKWKDSHEELSMKDYEKEAEEFKMKYIYSHISSTEQKEGTVALWLHSLNHINYPDLRIVNEEAIPDNKGADIEEAVTNNKSADVEETINYNKRVDVEEAINDNKGADIEEAITDNKRADIEEAVNHNKRATTEEAINDNKRADIEETITDNKRADIEEAITDDKRVDIEEAITDNKC
ncbi:tRNA pseudouridine synthase A-like isoform X2 [Cajanus cajan]|nr:tRNA pseudouridine synthase A-like isoform X2 [Cajanus cajan]XP_020202156.1 tRNA pseudouridine synthase A-like isoform X2 [Cajanus cajan]